MRWVAGRLDDFPPNSISLVTAGDREIGIIRWQDSVYAVLSLCPHAQAPLCRGALVPRLFSDRRQKIEVAEDRATLVCGWHRYEFDLETGRGVRMPRYKLKKYGVTVIDGDVVLELPGPRAAAGQ